MALQRNDTVRIDIRICSVGHSFVNGTGDEAMLGVMIHAMRSDTEKSYR